MRQFVFILISLGLLFGCFHDKETNDEVVLTLPFGKYYNWVNWEMKQINFKIQDNELLIDTTYDLKLHDFKTHHLERLVDYPEIAKFLKKSVTELQDLENVMSKDSCNNRHQFWIHYSDGTKLDIIKFRGADDCDPTHFGIFNSVYQELKELQKKYKP